MDRRAFWNCLGAHVWLKAIGSTLSITLFFVGYFAVLNHPVFPVRTMPVLALDRMIPILPTSVWLYFSLWVYVCLPAAIMDSRALLGRYLLGSSLLAGSGLAVFLLIPPALTQKGLSP